MPNRFIPVSSLFGSTPSQPSTPFLNPPAGATGLSAAPSFLSQLMPSRAAWQAGLDTAPLPGAIRGGPGDLARSLPSGKGKMNLKKAIESLGGRVLTIAERKGTAPGSTNPYVPVIERIVGPGGQRLEDPAYLYEYAKDWYRQAAMRAHPDKGGTEEAMQAVNAAWAFIEKHFGSQALRESLNPRLFQR